MRASATFSFTSTSTEIPPPPPPTDTEVTIQKIDAISRENIPGALMRLRGMSSHQVVTGDGQLWEIDNTGINVSQVLTIGATTAAPTGVTSTITRDGVWHLTGLPWGFYLVEEERSPDGYSLYPQHTAFGFWILPPNVHVNSPDGITYNIVEHGPNENHILITFENYPFSEIVVYKREASNGIGNNQLLPGAHFRIRGYYPGNPAIPIDRMGVTDARGRVVFSDIPAGAFTIEEVAPPSGHLLGEDTLWHVNVGWGQTIARGTAPTHTFFNPPKSSLEVLKVDGITNEPLSGAIFELKDPTTGETWQATSGENGIAVFGRGNHGNFLYPNHTYILREIQSPVGFNLMEGPREIVLSPGDENRATWHNYRNPSLTIIKECQDTGRRLAGARFSIVAQGSGRPLLTDFPLVTNENGEIHLPWTLFEGQAERTFLVTEEIPPQGFNLSNPNWQTVTLIAGHDNTVLFQNRRMPNITIEKRDARTGYPIIGAWFNVEYLGAVGGTGIGNIGQPGLLTSNSFVTDSQGRTVINAVHSGMYRITEIRSANNYWLDPLEQNRSWIITVRDNEDYTLRVENTLLPTLVITKRNALTWRPVPMTQFRVDFEVPNSPNVQHVGYFMTNMQGQVILPFVQVGWYRILETRPAPGMTLGTNNSFRVFLQPGDNSYALIRDSIIASESMVTPMTNAPPPPSDEPTFEPDEEREYIPSGNNNISNALTPSIPDDADVDVIDPDLGAIMNDELVPGQSIPANPPTLPDLPNFDDINLDDIEITLVDDPELIARLTSQMQVWGGDQLWNNDLGVWNFPQNSIIIRKENAVTGEPLGNATFSVTQISSGSESGLHGTIIGHFVTNASGIIVITGLDPGYLVIEEIIAPPNFTLSKSNRQHAFLRPDSTSVVELTFSNMPYSSLLVTLRCSVTSTPIPDGEFRITNSAGAVLGTANGHFRTNLQGEILIPNIAPDSFVITQVTVPPPFVINLTQSTQTIRVNPTGQIYRVDFFSDPLSQILVTLRCEITGQPLQGGEFRVTNSAGNVVGSANGIFFTDQQGEFTIPNLGVDSYVITQINPPTGFRLNHNDAQQNSQTIFVGRPAETYTANFTNTPYSGLIIQNLDAYNSDPLPGVRFRIDRIDNTGNVLIGEYVTDHEGRIELVGLLGSFTVVQVDVPNGWEHDPQPTRVVQVNAGAPTLVTFVSPRMGSLEITLSDEDGNPLAGGRFEVRRQNGQLIGEFVTPVSGMINIPNLGSGWFTVEQLSPPQGWVMTDTGRSVEVTTNSVVRANFINIQRPSLVIEKVDTQGNPLPNAEFEVRTLSGALLHRGTTTNGGIISIARLDPMAVIITETRAPDGFLITEPSRTVEIVAGETHVERFVNHRYATVVIHKICGDTSESLPDVLFKITTLAGERVRNPLNNSFEFVTDSSGKIRLPQLPSGTYVATELRSLPGFRLAQPYTFQIGHDREYVFTIRNYRYSQVSLHKIDGDTSQSLPNVVFEIHRQNGERLQNPVTNTFEFITDSAGRINLGFLPEGSFLAVEVRALPGFRLAEPTPFEVVQGRDLTVVVRNYRQAELTVLKVNSITREPLPNVHFEISRPDGTRLINPQNGNHTFITDSRGIIHLPAVDDGVLYLHEVRALPGFLVDQEITRVIINSESRNREHLAVIENTPASGLLVVVTDAQTRRPLEGIEVEVRHADGRLVIGQMLDGNQANTPANSPQLGPNGNFITDSRGRVYLNHITPGVYHVRLPNNLSGYQADTDVHVVTVVAGEQAVLELQITPLAGFRLLKICSVTREGIFNVEFMVFDSNNKVVGVFYTDNMGIIDFSAILAPGRYTIRETRPAPGFARDDVPRTVEFVAGRVTEIVWENVPIAGQLQILKVSGDANQHNGLPAGTPLAGAIFEIMDARTGNLVDRIISTERGMAVSRPLPLGRYIAREVAAPAFYMINPQEIHFDLEHENQIVRVTFPNFSANMGVSIRKTGPQEVMQGHNIFYEIPVVRNDSSTPLADFFWRDTLPVNAVRADRLITGTYNHALRYRIMATTNRGNTIIVADNLSTLTNNVIELRPVHLGLAADEFIIDFTLFFGQVPAGFTSVERPRIYVDVLSANQAHLPDGLMFANKVDVGGRIPGTDEWVIGNSTVAGTVFNPGSNRRIPQSGW